MAHGHMGKACGSGDLGCGPFMNRIEVSMHEGDGDRGQPCGHSLAAEQGEGLVIERG